LIHQQQLSNPNIARQVQFQIIQNQRKLQNQSNNATPLHSGQSAAALHAINNAKFQVEQVRNSGQQMVSDIIIQIFNKIKKKKKKLIFIN